MNEQETIMYRSYSVDISDAVQELVEIRCAITNLHPKEDADAIWWLKSRINLLTHSITELRQLLEGLEKRKDDGNNAEVYMFPSNK